MWLIALDILKVVVGLIYLYLEYYARPQMWIASVIMPIIGMVLFFEKGLYADFAINIYYLVIAVYGWWVWTRGDRRATSKHNAAKPSRSITHISGGAAAALLCLGPALWMLIWWVLVSYTDSTVPRLDSFTTAFSIVGMWMLARKYIEQWWVWLIVDSVYVYQYYVKGIYFSGTLYAFYAVMAVAGYMRWRKMMAAGRGA